VAVLAWLSAAVLSVGLAMARESGDAEITALTLNDLAHVYGMVGAIDQHRGAVREAAERWRALGNLPMLADCLATAALYASVRGDFASARQASSEALEIARRIGNVWGQAYSQSGIGYVLWLRGAYAEGIQANRECLRLAEEAGYGAAQTLNRSLQAEMLIDLGQVEEAGKEAHRALEWAEGHLPALRGVARGSLATYYAARGDWEEAAATVDSSKISLTPRIFWVVEPILRARAEAAIGLQMPRAAAIAEERVGAARQFGALPFVAAALETLARAQRLAGQRDAAVASLAEARELGEQLGTRRTLWRVYHGLAINSETSDEGAAWAAKSGSVVEAIAGELPEPRWREGFLKRVEAWKLGAT